MVADRSDFVDGTRLASAGQARSFFGHHNLPCSTRLSQFGIVLLLAESFIRGIAADRLAVVPSPFSSASQTALIEL